jgi:hypothetical protein
MKKNIIFVLIFLSLNVAVYCGQPGRIELTDGSVINGEIVSYVNGVYTINSSVFGEITLDATKVSRIESEKNEPKNSQVISTQAQVESYKQALMSNPESAAIIAGLAADPQIQKLANDPQIQGAVKSGDFETLIKNEKFMDFVNSSKLQEAVKKLKQ